MRREAPQPRSVLDYGRPCRRTVRWFPLAVGLMAATMLLQARLLSVALLGLAIVPCALVIFRRKAYLIVVASVVCLASFLPFDVALGSFHVGSRVGTSPGRPHFVRFVVGMPRHSYLIKTYGEYIGGGCSWPAIFPPRWIWVWD